MEHDGQTEEGVHTPLVHTFKHVWRTREAQVFVCVTFVAIITIMTSIARKGGGVGTWCIPAGPNSSVRDFEWVSVHQSCCHAYYRRFSA